MKLIGMIFLIALSIMLPLIKFYQRSNWVNTQKLINILLFSFLCFLIHAPLHEFCHFISGKLMSIDIIDYQFFSKLSFKNFQSAYISFSGSTSTNQWLMITMSPYIKDIIFALVSFLILKRKQIKSSFLVGLIFSTGLLLSAFNIFENLLGYINKFGDWNTLSKTMGHFWTWVIGIIMLGSTLFLIYRIFMIYKGFPEKINLEAVPDTNKEVLK
jgi:hypothetical protein